MRRIVAIVPPHVIWDDEVSASVDAGGRRSAVPDLRQALIEVGANGMSVAEAKGLFWVQRKEFGFLDTRPELRVEVVMETDLVEAAVQAICDAVMRQRTDASRRGIIWVEAIESVSRIRTGETGERAL